MKMNFQTFQEEFGKKEKFFETVDNKKYSNEDLEYQKNLLAYMVEEIREYCQKGKNIEENKKFIRAYVFAFVYAISRPSFYDFYIIRAMEYLIKNDGILRENVASFILKNKDITKVIAKQKNTTENVDINIEVAIAIILNGFKDYTHVKPGRFTEIQTKISENKLSAEDIDDTTYYVKKMMEQYIGNNIMEFYKWMKKNPEEVYKIFKSSVKNIFEVQEPEVEKEEVDLDTLFSEEYIKGNKTNLDFKLKSTKMSRGIKIKDFLENPLYSSDKRNNVLIYWNSFFENLKDEDLESLYSLLEKINDSKDSKKMEKIVQEVLEKAVKARKPEDDKDLYLVRILELLKLQRITGCYEKFNSLNNERLEKFRFGKIGLN